MTGDKELEELLKELREERIKSFKVVFPKIIRRNRRGKVYKRLEIVEGVPSFQRYIIMPFSRYMELLRIYDEYLVLKALCRRFLVRLETDVEMLRKWLTDFGRYMEEVAKEYEEEGKHSEADITRFRLKVYTNELRFREGFLSQVKKMLEGINIWKD
ncbi:MAG: hypothetical protein DRN49_05750 [Thaumarchaeota archaeon]|nr:MAG: hypothetical protein DRN49_05750 [Nitrososphaerota archaeon]